MQFYDGYICRVSYKDLLIEYRMGVQGRDDAEGMMQDATSNDESVLYGKHYQLRAWAYDELSQSPMNEWMSPNITYG
jgi:hypothetical protein